MDFGRIRVQKGKIALPFIAKGVSPCSQVWRGTLARLRYKRTKAALTILKYYRRYKVKSYIREVARRFHNVRQMKDYGKHVPWPTPPKVLRRFEEALQIIYHRYKGNLLSFQSNLEEKQLLLVSGKLEK